MSNLCLTFIQKTVSSVGTITHFREGQDALKPNKHMNATYWVCFYVVVTVTKKKGGGEGIKKLSVHIWTRQKYLCVMVTTTVPYAEWFQQMCVLVDLSVNQHP